MAVTRVYEEVVDFLAASTNTVDLIAFRPSAEARARVGELLAREKTNALTANERSELDHYLQLEHLLRLAKARARRRSGT